MTTSTRGNAGRVSFDIDGGSSREDIERTAVFGSVDTEHGRGRTALPADAANGRTRDYLVSRLKAVGFDIRIGTIDSTAGRWAPDDIDLDAAPVATGSHLDSVPDGGIFDGPLGVYATVEAIRGIRENDLAPARPLEVVCFTGEEGTCFANDVLGSMVAIGKRGVDETLAPADDDMTLEGALDRVGYRGSGRLDASVWNARVELYTGQNTRLGGAGVPFGIATDIIRAAWCHVPIGGQADHSGATEMTTHHDALAAASELVLEVERRTADIAVTGGSTAVGTVGKFDAEPNIVNVVPGAASLRLNLRSVDREEVHLQLDAVEWALDAVRIRHDVTTSFGCTYDVPLMPLSERCRWVATEASRACDIETLSLHSGAGHDTMRAVGVTDAAFVFVTSESGRSHSPRERANWADCTTVTEVLAEVLARLVATDDTETGDIERD